MRIPRRLLEKARARGIDVESFVAEALARALGIDPREEAEVHLELAERFLEEGRELLRKGDPVQASEKLYRVAEECIKAMAMALGLEESKEARARGTWRGTYTCISGEGAYLPWIGLGLLLWSPGTRRGSA